MGTKKASIQCFFDVISPYSWFAFEALTRYRNIWPDVSIKMRPIFLGGVMKATGNQPPMMLPARVPYMAADMKRNADYWQVPIAGWIADPFDSMLTKGSLPAMRFLVSLERTAPDKVEAATRELWMRRWNRDEDIHLADHLIKVCEVIGVDNVTAQDTVAKIEHPDVKKTLIANTMEAVEEHGAFGAPWIVVNCTNGQKHVFFGSDRFPIIAHVLDKEFPGPMTKLAAHKAKL